MKFLRSGFFIVFLLLKDSAQIMLRLPACNKINRILCCTERVRRACPTHCHGVVCEIPRPVAASRNPATTRPRGRPSPVRPANRVPAAGNRPVPRPISNPRVPQRPPCGVPPGYLPCVSNTKANALFTACCQQKNMGKCSSFCRYDTAGFREAMRIGQCRLNQAADFLYCSSGGHNNQACCDSKNVIERTGSQCSVFCNPTNGVGRFGIRHLVCQKAAEDIKQCHIASLR